jgi:exodeoxyribonuclease V alpha subunit
VTDKLPANLPLAARPAPGSRPGQRSIFQGNVSRITFQSPESHYTVARLAIENAQPVTIVGEIYPLREGEEIKVSGFWNSHPRYGMQLKVDQWEKIEPVTLEGIGKYLGSGLIKGIGPAYAGRLVAAFGLDTLTVLSRAPQRLLEVQGIGPARARRIIEIWNEHHGMREVLVFLQGHGLSSNLALKIYRAYGQETVAKVKENPYQLADDIYGIGFLLADRIAGQFGTRRDSPPRVRAGVRYLLQRSADEGHCYVPLETLTNHVVSLLQIDESAVADGIKDLSERGEVVLESQVEEVLPHVYARNLYEAEKRVAFALRQLSCVPPAISLARGTEIIERLQTRSELFLQEEQKQALLLALRHKVLVITGGPGTGKTTLLTHLLALLRNLQIRFALAAPTGRAAKRMEEASGEEAKTIHRLLEYNPRDGGFQRTEKNPLPANVVIIDEASMIDLSLMDQLLRALDPKSRLILLGDVDQLPSVGPGNVLRDLIESRAVPVATLRQIFRQAAESLIVVNAHRILEGKALWLPDASAGKDFAFIARDEPEEILATLKELVQEEITRQLGEPSLDGVQVLTPMNRGLLGTIRLNEELQELLNPRGETVGSASSRLRLGDRVMQLRNNYEKGVFNGDLGRIVEVDKTEGKITVDFEGTRIVYEADDLDELSLAYATSVHKSQGSEYPVVVIPLHTSHYMMLHRSILYTAMTRGKRRVILVGSKKAVALAMRNVRVERRFTGLRGRLMSRS